MACKKQHWQHSITRQTRWDIHLDEENILNRLKNPRLQELSPDGRNV